MEKVAQSSSLFILKGVDYVQDVATMIQTLGFPMACVVACAYFILRKDSQSREDALVRENRMFEQQEKLTETLEKSTNTIERMNIRLDVIEAKIDKITTEK